MFERSTGDLASRGVGIGTHVERSTSCAGSGITVDESIGVAFSSRRLLGHDGSVIARLPFEQILTSWTLLYRALRGSLPDPCYRAGMELHRRSFTCRRRNRGLRRRHEAAGDLLVGADGLHSTVRARASAASCRRFTPATSGGAASSRKAGAARRARRPGEVLRSSSCRKREMMLSYLQPGADDDLARDGDA